MAALTWRGSFVLLGALSLVWVGVWFFYFRDDPREHRGVGSAEAAAPPAYRGKGSLGAAPVPWRALTLRMLPVIVVYFCYGWTL